jgi:opacity protein-like surface antigen
MFGQRARTSIGLMALMVTIAGLTFASPASAEFFVDLYLGGAFTEKHDVDTEFPAGTVSALDVSFNKSFTGGLRGGYWLPFDVGPLNFGFGVDLSHFAPNIERQSTAFCENFCVNGVFDDIDLSVWVIGFDALLRAPLLKSSAFPNGQLQPYLRVGPAIFVAHANDRNNFSPGDQTDSDTSIGVKLGAGVAWLFTRNIGIFGEYRYTHFSPEFTFTDGGFSADMSSSINTHSLLFGATFRF